MDARSKEGGSAKGEARALNRAELLQLFHDSASVTKDELSAAYQYLNFYVGLIAAILAATLLGLLQLPKGDWLDIALLSGCVITICLAIIGYGTVNVFYRRFAEAWVTQVNLSALLGLSNSELTELPSKPRYPSKEDGGPFARPLSPDISEAFARGHKEGWTGERMADEIRKLSPTLRYALLTFGAYVVIAIVLAVFIVVRVFA